MDRGLSKGPVPFRRMKAVKLIDALKALVVSLCYAELRMQVKLGMGSDSKPYRSACCML